MSDKFWHTLLVIVLIGKVIELGYRFYKWIKNKKNKNL
jgi:hypothetical protein